MQKKIKFFLILYYIFASLPLYADNKYPETQAERKWDEVGSIAGQDGITFSPGKIKNESTKTNSTIINKYLWQASLETINFAPLASADSNGGVIITDWYTPKSRSNYRFKINIFITDNIISPDSIDVKIFEEVIKNNRWVSQDSTSDLAYILEDKILRKARDLYIIAARKN